MTWQSDKWPANKTVGFLLLTGGGLWIALVLAIRVLIPLKPAPAWRRSIHELRRAFLQIGLHRLDLIGRADQFHLLGGLGQQDGVLIPLDRQI